jgi:hypothetical protein
LLASLALALASGRAAGQAGCVSDIRNAASDGSFCHNGTAAAPAQSPAAPAANSSAASAAGSVIGSVLGGALAAPTNYPAYQHVSPKPVVGDDDDSAPDPGTSDAQDIIAGFNRDGAALPCPDDPDVVCIGQGTPDMSLLGENPVATADAALSDVPPAPLSAPPPPPEPETKTDTARDSIAAVWDDFTEAVSLEEIGRVGLKELHAIPAALTGLSEKVGTGANVVALADASVSASEGQTAKASGQLTGVAVGVASEPAGLAAAVCGQVNPCVKASVTGFNAVVDAPANIGAAAVKSFPSKSLIEGYKLQYNMTDAQALQKYNQVIDDSANRVKDDGQNESFVKGVLGASQ